MTLPLPNLDSRRYDDLVEELKALIPQWAPHWTNYNPSDPGITLMELLAWATEATLYRLNQTPDQAHWNLIKLLRPGDDEDPTWSRLSGQSLETAKALALKWYNERYRAVTSEDYEQLVLTSAFPDETLTIARVKANAAFSTGIVTMIIILRDYPYLDFPSEQLQQQFVDTKAAVKDFLDQRRLVGTRIRVRGPVSTDIKIDVSVELVPGTALTNEDLEKVRGQILSNIYAYLDPLTGGFDGAGWPFAHPVSIYDIRPQVESVIEVGRVIKIILDDDVSCTVVEVVDLPRIKELNVTLSNPTD